jgi:hypothetical protein
VPPRCVTGICCDGYRGFHLVIVRVVTWTIEHERHVLGLLNKEFSIPSVRAPLASPASHLFLRKEMYRKKGVFLSIQCGKAAPDKATKSAKQPYRLVCLSSHPWISMPASLSNVGLPFLLTHLFPAVCLSV